MIDIKERIQKAIELHKRGIDMAAIEFQKLLFKITDPIQKKQIRQACLTGCNPLEQKADKEVGTATENASIAGLTDLEAAIKSNLAEKPVIERSVPETPQKNNPSFYKEKHSQNKYKNNAGKNIVVQSGDHKLPPEWKFGGLEPHTFGGYMYAYCMVSFWGKSGEDQKIQHRNHIERNFAGAETALAKADNWLKPALECYRKYCNGDRSPELMSRIEKLGDPLVRTIKKDAKKAAEQKQKKEAQANHKVTIAVPELKTTKSSTFTQIPTIKQNEHNVLNYHRHCNDITGLQPEKDWTLLIDESGNSEDGDFSTTGRGEGVIAGVLYPTGSPLPRPLFPELHASSDGDETKIAAGDKLIENLLNGKQFGVLALPIKSLRSSREWGAAIGLLVDLVLRLLPLDGKTKLNVLVENKGAYEAFNDFAFLRDACYYRLMQSLPERSELITLAMNVMDKKHPLNSYPDVVANTCFAWSRVARERLRISGWEKSCYLKYPAEDLARVLEYYYTGKHIRPSDWSDLLGYDGMSGQNFISGILSNLGKELNQDVSVWSDYLRYTVDHLNSKAINLRLLERQVSYLMNCQPLEKEIPAHLNLLWLTSRLASKNHHGELIDDDEEKEFRRLIRLTYPEDSQLACWTTLHLAVAMTDSFDFSRAKRIIRDYYDVRKYMEEGPQNLYSGEESRFATTPVVIPGINYFAQMLSSYGQHEAFSGNPQSAVRYFRKALELFEKLSDKTECAKQSPQTRAYLILALMDMPSMQKEFHAEFLRYFGKTAQYAVRDYSTNTSKPYSHHILVRAMADHLLPAGAIKAYLADQNNWQKESWHPWELIEFYRGVLSKSLDDKKKYMRSAYEIALRDGGATMRVIGCGILGALYFHDQSVKKELEDLTDRVIAELPKLGPARIAAMRKQIISPEEPMTYIKKVNPFNFR